MVNGNIEGELGVCHVKFLYFQIPTPEMRKVQKFRYAVFYAGIARVYYRYPQTLQNGMTVYLEDL